MALLQLLNATPGFVWLCNRWNPGVCALRHAPPWIPVAQPGCATGWLGSDTTQHNPVRGCQGFQMALLQLLNTLPGLVWFCKKWYPGVCALRHALPWIPGARPVGWGLTQRSTTQSLSVRAFKWLCCSCSMPSRALCGFV